MKRFDLCFLVKWNKKQILDLEMLRFLKLKSMLEMLILIVKILFLQHGCINQTHLNLTK